MIAQLHVMGSRNSAVLPLPRHPSGLDHVHDPHLVGPPIRVALDAQVLPGEQVRMLDRAVLGDLNDPPSYLKVAILVVGIEDREGDTGISAHVLVLHPPARRVNANVLAVEVEPDGCDLWASVRHHGGKIDECLPRGDEIEELGRDRASGRDVLRRVGTARPCSLNAVIAEAGTAGSEESEQRGRKDRLTNRSGGAGSHSAFACFGGLPGPRRLRRLRVRVCGGAACSTLGGRPGPRRIRVFDPGGRPGPRRLRLRRRLRPFAGFFFVPVLPRSPCTASCTCSRTRSRITVTRLFRRGIPVLPGAPIRLFRKPCPPSREVVPHWIRTGEFTWKARNCQSGSCQTRRIWIAAEPLSKSASAT